MRIKRNNTYNCNIGIHKVYTYLTCNFVPQFLLVGENRYSLLYGVWLD